MLQAATRLSILCMPALSPLVLFMPEGPPLATTASCGCKWGLATPQSGRIDSNGCFQMNRSFNIILNGSSTTPRGPLKARNVFSPLAGMRDRLAFISPQSQTHRQDVTNLPEPGQTRPGDITKGRNIHANGFSRQLHSGGNVWAPCR